MGRYWVASAVMHNGGQREIRYGLLNDAGQWLVPTPLPTLQLTVLFGPGGRSSHYAEMLASQLPRPLGRNVQVHYMPSATEDSYRRLMLDDGDTKVLLAALRLPRNGIEGVHKASPQSEPINQLLPALRPVTLLASQPLVLVIDSAKADALGIHSTEELLAHAKAHPGRLRIGTGEDGWTTHLAFGQFHALSGVDVQRVIFKGRDPGSNAITKDHAVELMFAPMNRVRIAVQRGQLHVLGTTAYPAYPQIVDGQPWPTLASNPTLRGFTVYDHFSLWAPANSDAAYNRTLQQAVAQVLAKPEIQKHLQDIYVVGGGGSPESLLQLEEQEREGWMRALSLPEP